MKPPLIMIRIDFFKMGKGNNMKRTFFLGFVWIGLVLFALSGTACAATLKIGIIDTQKIMMESKAAKDARGIFLMDVERKRSELHEKQTQVQSQERELREKAKEMSRETLQKKKDELEQDVKELRRLKNDMEEELKKKDVSLTRKLLEEIREIVEAFTKKNKFTVVMEKKAVVAFDEAIDITDQIIKEYDAKKKK